MPHGIYWHTSYGVLGVCYFTLRATRAFIKLAIKSYTLHNCLTKGFEWHVTLKISHCTHLTKLMYVQLVSIPIWRVANIVPMLQVRNFESNSTIPRPLMWEGHDCSRTYLLQVNQFFKPGRRGSKCSNCHILHMSAFVFETTELCTNLKCVAMHPLYNSSVCNDLFHKQTMLVIHSNRKWT